MLAHQTPARWLVFAVGEEVGRWTSENGHVPSGPMFNVLIVSPAQDPNPANWVTEMSWPIATRLSPANRR